MAAGVDIEQHNDKQDFNGMQFAFGPKILMDPTFAITFQEVKQKFKGVCKISKDATLILSDNESTFNNLEVGPTTLICKTGVKYPADPIVFEKSSDADQEVYKIRGYKPLKQKMSLSAPARERTYIMIKPDGVQRGLVGKIMERFETKGFKLVACKLAQPGKEMFEKHYADLSKKGFFKGLVEYAASGPVCCMVWEGDNAILTGRKMLGATKPFDSEPGTIRGDFCIDVGRNVIHGSDCVEAANHEIALWFKPEELVDWTQHSDTWVYE
jgi:nucleoside-diphosphate kinase